MYGVHDSQECEVVVDRIMELDVEFDWNDGVIAFFQEHRHLVVDDEGLPRLVESQHELVVFLTDQVWHEIFNPIDGDILVSPLEQLLQAFVHLNEFAEARAISIDDDEVGVVRVLLLGKVLLIDLVDFQDRTHLPYIELVGR
jgi:hypothetical protein